MKSVSTGPVTTIAANTSLPQNAKPEAAALFPIFLRLEGRACLVIGAGAVAQPKIASLLASGAKVTVVAPRAGGAVRAWAEAGEIRWEARPFVPADLDGAFLAVAATSVTEVNQQVFQEARRRNILVNAVDDPPHCDFYYGSVVRRGALQIAISTDGKSPALAQRLRQEMENTYGGEYERWLDELGRERQQLFAIEMDRELRCQWLHALASRKSYEEFVCRLRVAENGEDQE
ncbi:MAG TPA: bifunctional precorrin-2 dehydrogenase/sirohydrochlorin ferrochelatase [Terriglobia bacterium]|nr:bifunctional precorrin-2 dehydrogenase/sirohydrochlorin ferrochelatase [Terriglobia bacterium]